MSIFISSIFAAGLIEMPPVSKVTALPTRPSVSPLAPGPEYRSVIRRGSSALPLATATSPPIPRLSISARSRASALTLSWAAAISAARSAR